MPYPYPQVLDVQVEDAKTKDTAISTAVQELIPEAIRSRTGISVTRCSITDFQIAVDLSVPCGEIHERVRI
ncbi:hypothetical protein QFZ60_002272 [Arthrobacter sp. B2I5]|nr:hypothetical protein [Arthrobacter sp. B2I5]